METVVGTLPHERTIFRKVLMLLYDSKLQWRFANVRADATFMLQKLRAEICDDDDQEKRFIVAKIQLSIPGQSIGSIVLVLSLLVSREGKGATKWSRKAWKKCDLSFGDG